VVLAALALATPINPARGGHILFRDAPGAALDLAPGALQIPADLPSELRFTILPPTALPLPLPPAFVVGAAADLQPQGATLATAAQLTLPNHGGLAAGQVVALLLFDTTTLSYTQVGYGRVSDDGTQITTTSGGLPRLAPVVFASTPVTAQSALVAVAGERQRGVVGDLLPTPFTVQARDGADQGIPGVPVLMTVTAGDGTLLPATAQVTDAQGQVSSRLLPTRVAKTLWSRLPRLPRI
jgi:hypothetical protein